MRINRQLNIIVPVDVESGTVHVHCEPLNQEVFDRFFLVISKTFAALYQQGLNIVAGPRIAGMLLKKTAQDLGIWEGDDGVEQGLMSEIRRRANVAVPGPAGWTQMPLQSAEARGVLDEQDISEVEGALVFFIVVSAMHSRKDLPGILGGMVQLWAGDISSSSFTEFLSSLATSTPAAPTGEKVKASSTA